MIVYHYLNRQYGLESLYLRRLRASVVHKLRDPFEHCAYTMSEDDDARYKQVLIDMAKPNPKHGQGIISFSGTFSSPVMWSQYADNHSGLCLGFEIPNIEHASVSYVSDRPPVRLSELDIEKLLICIRTKFKEWEYEDEYRALVPLDPATLEGGNFFIDYSEQLQLRQVIVGANCELNRATIQRALQAQQSPIELFRVRPSPNDFRMIANDTVDW